MAGAAVEEQGWVLLSASGWAAAEVGGTAVGGLLIPQPQRRLPGNIAQRLQNVMTLQLLRTECSPQGPHLRPFPGGMTPGALEMPNVSLGGLCRTWPSFRAPSGQAFTPASALPGWAASQARRAPQLPGTCPRVLQAQPRPPAPAGLLGL